MTSVCHRLGRAEAQAFPPRCEQQKEKKEYGPRAGSKTERSSPYAATTFFLRPWH